MRLSSLRLKIIFGLSTIKWFSMQKKTVLNSSKRMIKPCCPTWLRFIVWLWCQDVEWLWHREELTMRSKRVLLPCNSSFPLDCSNQSNYREQSGWLILLAICQRWVKSSKSSLWKQQAIPCSSTALVMQAIAPLSHFNPSSRFSSASDAKSSPGSFFLLFLLHHLLLSCSFLLRLASYMGIEKMTFLSSHFHKRLKPRFQMRF